MGLRHISFFFPLDCEVPLPALVIAGRPEPTDLPQETITKVPGFYSSTASEPTVNTLGIFVCCTESPGATAAGIIGGGLFDFAPNSFQRGKYSWHYVGTGLYMLYEILQNLRTPTAYRKIAPGSSPAQAPMWAIPTASSTNIADWTIRPISINLNLDGIP